MYHVRVCVLAVLQVGLLTSHYAVLENTLFVETP
jgi:hypothetical protein